MFSLIKTPYCNTNPQITIYALLLSFWIGSFTFSLAPPCPAGKSSAPHIPVRYPMSPRILSAIFAQGNGFLCRLSLLGAVSVIQIIWNYIEGWGGLVCCSGDFIPLHLHAIPVTFRGVIGDVITLFTLMSLKLTLFTQRWIFLVIPSHPWRVWRDYSFFLVQKYSN